MALLICWTLSQCLSLHKLVNIIAQIVQHKHKFLAIAEAILDTLKALYFFLDRDCIG